MPTFIFALRDLPPEAEAATRRERIWLSAATGQGLAPLFRQRVRLGSRAAGIFPRAVMHVPIETARAARARAAELGADVAVAVGGGSTIGLGKAIALESGLPIIAIPTTYAGSEMTTI